MCRNTYFGPNEQFWDTSIQKMIPIGFHHFEHQALTLRAEFFNALNHGNHGLPDVNLADGPTGPAIAEHLSSGGVAVVFHTSDAGRIPADFAHALGVLEKPSTPVALAQVVDFVTAGAAGSEPPMALRLLERSPHRSPTAERGQF